MTISKPQARALIAEIEDAFGALEPPGDQALLHPQCMDDVDTCHFYGAPRWQEVTAEILVPGYAAPSFFSAEAFRYYMPAYMVWALENPDSPEMAVESAIRAFDPSYDDPRLTAFQRSKFVLFDSAQRRTIIHFLEAFAASGDGALEGMARAALDAVWREAS